MFKTVWGISILFDNVNSLMSLSVPSSAPTRTYCLVLCMCHSIWSPRRYGASPRHLGSSIGKCKYFMCKTYANGKEIVLLSMLKDGYYVLRQGHHTWCLAKHYNFIGLRWKKLDGKKKHEKFMKMVHLEMDARCE